MSLQELLTDCFQTIFAMAEIMKGRWAGNLLTSWEDADQQSGQNTPWQIMTIIRMEPVCCKNFFCKKSIENDGAMDGWKFYDTSRDKRLANLDWWTEWWLLITINEVWLNAINDDLLRIMMKKWLNMAPRDRQIVFSYWVVGMQIHQKTSFSTLRCWQGSSRPLPYSTASVGVCGDDYFNYFNVFKNVWQDTHNGLLLSIVQNNVNESIKSSESKQKNPPNANSPHKSGSTVLSRKETKLQAFKLDLNTKTLIWIPKFYTNFYNNGMKTGIS